MLNGDYSPVEVPDSLTAFDDRRLDIAADGTFELRFGPPRPDAPAGYVPLGPGSAMLACARSTATGPRERRGTLRIQRADKIGGAPPPPDEALLAKRYGVAGKILLSRLGPSWPSPSGST